MKNIYLLGATGSIGQQTLDIIRDNPKLFKLKAVTAYSQFDKIIDIIEEFSPEIVCVKDLTDALKLRNKFSDLLITHGRDGLKEVAIHNKDDENAYLLNALVGMVGLEPTIEAIKINRHILLANKETLVVGGHLIRDLRKDHEINLYPIDSEHNALWQLLNHENIKDVKRLIITASGGSFRDLSRDQLKDVSVDDALKHPNWSMGAKITIDSATMMNKGFEVIEACYLFDLDIEQVQTIIHKESLVHSMVEYVDGSILAHFSEPDMHLPIAYALFYPDRKTNTVKALDLMKLNHLSFQPMDLKRYPCFELAIKAYQIGGSMRTVLNAANEAAVDLFLKGKISFIDIETIIKNMMDKHDLLNHPSLEEIYEIDGQVKEAVYRLYS
jgi:1-deoxy-D-xylulose-5-phosphate reductoisomerase